MTRVAALAFALFLVGGTAFSPAAQAQDAFAIPNVSSGWTNQSGSVMTLNFGPGAAVSGTYVNNAAGFGCQGTPYALSGWVLGNFISFSVAWNNGIENCNSVTGWTGYAHIAGGTVQIQTNWSLAYQSGSGPQIMTGQDTFTQTSTMQKDSPLE
jgi:hypothetical protein